MRSGACWDFSCRGTTVPKDRRLEDAHVASEVGGRGKRAAAVRVRPGPQMRRWCSIRVRRLGQLSCCAIDSSEVPRLV
eukprot:351749-Chlamydomonas_euryale.AAC.3